MERSIFVRRIVQHLLDIANALLQERAMLLKLLIHACSNCALVFLAHRLLNCEVRLISFSLELLH